MAARGGSVHGGQVGGNVHPLPLPRRRLVESAALSFSLRVDNFPHIRQAYGEDAARAVLVQLTRRLSDALGVNGLVEPGPNGVMECLIWRHAGQSGNSVAECVDWLKRLCADAPLLPVETSVGSIHFALSADELISASAMPTVTSVLGQVGGGFAGDVARPDSGWAEQYRSDMAMAVRSGVSPFDISAPSSRSRLWLGGKRAAPEGRGEPLDKHARLSDALDRGARLRRWPLSAQQPTAKLARTSLPAHVTEKF